MPSPIAHMAAGAAIYQHRFGRRSNQLANPGLLVACIGLSLLPDLDAAVGIIAGNLGRYHNNFAGSPAFGTLVALSAGAIMWMFRRHLAWPTARLVFVCYQVHVLMDFLTISRGTMLLWPFSTERFSPPVHLFYGLRWSHGLASELHLITLATEFAFVAVLAAVLLVFDRRRKAQATEPDPGSP